MKKFLEKRHRFSLRKLAIGLVSTFKIQAYFVSLQQWDRICSRKCIYSLQICDHVTELSKQEKDLIVKDFPNIAEDSESTYYLVYRMDEKAQLGQLPHTGEHSNLVTVLSGGALASIGLLIFAVSKKSKKKALLKRLF